MIVPQDPKAHATAYALLVHTFDKNDDELHVYAPYPTLEAAREAMERAWGGTSVYAVEIEELKTPADLPATSTIYEGDNDQS